MAVYFVVILVIFLLLVSALYVGAEFATVSVRRTKIELMAEQGNRLVRSVARQLLPHLQSTEALDRYVAACQIGITLCSLLLGAMGQRYVAPYLAPVFGSFLPEGSATSAASVIIIMLMFTALQVVLGELVPKAIALRFTAYSALVLTWPMLISLRIFAPFIWLLNGSGTLVLKLMGYPVTASHHVHSPEELETLIYGGRTPGPSASEEQQRLGRVLRFGSKTAAEIMVPRTSIVAIDLDEGPEAALKIIEQSPYSRYPVYRGSADKILGMLHLMDVCINFDKLKQPQLGLRKWRPVVFCPATMTADKVLEKLRSKRAYMAIIEDEYGGTAGLLTIEDLLEEVLGSIEDEFDESVKDVEKLGEGRLSVSGLLDLEELSYSYGVELQTEGVNTVGGLVMHLTDGAPRVGQVVDYLGFSIKVEQMSGRQVMRALISSGGQQ